MKKQWYSFWYLCWYPHTLRYSLAGLSTIIRDDWFCAVLAIFHFILWQVSSGEGQSRMTFFWSWKIGSGLDKFLREMEDWCILVCLRLNGSQKPEVTRFFENERKIRSFMYVWLIFTLIWLKFCNFTYNWVNINQLTLFITQFYLIIGVI